MAKAGVGDAENFINNWIHNSSSIEFLGKCNNRSIIPVFKLVKFDQF